MKYKRREIYDSLYFLFIMGLTLSLCGGSGCHRIAQSDVKRVYIKDKVLVVEIANDLSEKERGLQKRENLPYDRGMLFVYNEETFLRFWMKDTSIPLDIAFIDTEGRIVEIQQMHPFETKVYRSKERVPYALEVNQYWFRDNGISVGDRVENL